MLSEITNISSEDFLVGTAFTILSFLASVVVGSTSLGDGIFLQVTWGVFQGLFPLLCERSSLGSDGMRVVTIFMYIRTVIIPPYLLWLLWNGPRKAQKKLDKQLAIEAAQRASGEITTSEDVPHSATPTPSSSPVSKNAPPPPQPVTFSKSLFWLLLVPSIVWSVIGIMILQSMKSSEIAVYLGVICISFSFLYLALKMWKASPARKSMPQWLQNVLSPQFLVPGTETDQITYRAQFVIFLAFNLSGLMVTLAGIGAPPMMIVILLYEMPMRMTRFTFPVAGLFSSIFRLGYAMYAGLLTFELWPFFLPASIATFIGIKVGVGIGNVLSPSMYSAAIFCLLILAGTVMLTKNPFVTVTSLTVSCAALIYKQFVWDPREAAKEASLSAETQQEEMPTSISDSGKCDNFDQKIAPEIVDNVVQNAYSILKHEDLNRASINQAEALVVS